MTHPHYERALQRSDLSQWVVHFVRSHTWITPQQLGNAGDTLNNIFREMLIRPSQLDFVTRYCPEGAACFYDAPPSVWGEIGQSNPSSRQPIGIIVHKTALWQLGGRPVIYTENANPAYWPESERYRIVKTDLGRLPQPLDWTHEREWRVRGGLSLAQSQMNATWWWPIVPNMEWVNYLFATYSGIKSIYAVDRLQLVQRISQSA